MADLQNTNLQDPNSIVQALSTLIGQGATNVAVPPVSSLSLALPSYTDMDQQFKDFLNKASQDPGIVNYYNSLFSKAQGDYNTAVSYLQADYTTGVRQQVDTTKANLENLGLTFGKESDTLANTLNQRGISQTQDPNNAGATQYAGGGQAATELGNLNTSQKLRSEAESRSASQNITNMGQNKQKGVSSAGQTLANTTQNLQSGETQAITNEAQNKYNVYQNETAAKAAQAQNQANYPTANASTTNGPLSMAKRQSDYAATGGKGDLPVGFEAA